ncbi:hypothetical protein ASD83_12220 [Devosia sp. Root685]|uniref:DUF4153 domain-containing protein n=1 Tax=Devosia sp. Root685 TaxID=1736587 RepID=UPI0006F56B85|nr:DUF4173 domain-containing protein [Devosia sp. Root685]KRA97841.1 hypothetical protein ASD83_12220 [Devosia sp. Root685]
MQETDQFHPAPKTLGLAAVATLTTLLLVVVSDLLLFDAEPGINLFLLTLGIALAIAAFAWRRGRVREGLLGLATALVLALPLIEAPSPLGLMLAALGLALSALIAIRVLPGRLEHMPTTVLRFLLPAPITLARDAVALRIAAQPQLWQRALLGLLAWIVPLGLGLVFVFLFAAANPLVEALFAGLRAERAFDLLNPVRVIFWLVMAAGIWALLRPKLLRRKKSRLGTPLFAPRETTWLGHAAILRSLVIFNALFALETALDLTFLWGGMALPNGMSHAEYAHRGAYPLIVTALLAAAFVLVAMRRDGPGQRSVLIRVLVYGFIAQNVLLCLSAMLRLELYVEVYSLTGLRLAAGIWMALVAVGLVLILLRIWWKRSNAWLVACNLVALLVVLYGSALMDFSALIARFNVAHSLEVSGEGMPLDLRYISLQGTSVIPALDSFIASLKPNQPAWQAASVLRANLGYQFTRRETGWRSWSWRQQRLADYLRLGPVASGPQTLQNTPSGSR